MKKAIRRDDLVVVITGVEKGSRGKVLRVDRQAQRVYVEGVMKRRVARKRRGNQPGGFVEREAPIHISNVMLAERYDERRAKRAQ